MRAPTLRRRNVAQLQRAVLVPFRRAIAEVLCSTTSEELVSQRATTRSEVSTSLNDFSRVPRPPRSIE